MDIGNWIFAIEFGVLFGAVVLFCWWQLRSLDKLDAEDAEKERLTAQQDAVEDNI